METDDMANPLLTGIGLATLLAASAAAGASEPGVASQAGDPTANPLLAPWSGPYGGVPPFADAKVELFRPALEAAMAEKLAEIEAIAANPEPATFANTIAALEVPAGPWIACGRSMRSSAAR
jgi:peptidyl-dipeptidase Dcp